MNIFSDNKYEYLSNFFKTAIDNNRLFHSIIFYGSNVLIQYAFALELARRLNCLEDKREDCNCQNCRWIRENKHPAVMTISKIDNKEDSSKTVISEEQIANVLNSLINSSNYHRVFIFCDAEIKNLSSVEKSEIQDFINTGFNPPQNKEGEEKWYPSGLNSSCISQVAINSMLKSLEEPEGDITFIFLTNNKDDLLQTIVSRSQAFFIPEVKSVEYDTKFLEKYFANYPVFKKDFALEFSEFLYAYQVEHKSEPEYILNCLQYYFLQMIKANSSNTVLFNMINKDIKKIEEAKRMLKSYIKEAEVYENLAFYFADK